MIVLILYSIVHLLEAWLEETVIELKNANLYNYAELNKREHFRSACLAIAWILCGMQTCFHLEQWWIMAALLVNRRIFFDYGLVIFRNRPRKTYEGNDKWVKFFISVFGKEGRQKELAIELVITAGCVIAHLLTAKFVL